MTKPDLSTVLIIVFCIIGISSCRTKSIQVQEKSVASVRQEIKESIYTTEENRMDILPKLDRWIEDIKKGKVVQSKAAQDTLLAQCYTYQADVYQSYESDKIALDLYNQALRLDSSNINTFFNRASLYTNIHNDHTKANKEFSRIIDKKPAFADAYHARGLTYFRRKMYTEAIVDFNKAIELDSTQQVYIVDKTQAFKGILSSENALEQISGLIELYPMDVQAYLYRTSLYRAMQDNDKALKDFTTIIDINRNDFMGYMWRAAFYYSLGQYENSLADYTRVIDICPDHSVAYSFRGVLYENMKDFDKALADYSYSLQLREAPLTYFYRGNVYISLKKYKEAIADLSKAIEMEPDYFDAYENRATSYRAVKEFDKALTDYTFIIERNPGSAPTYYNRGVLYLIMKKYDEALSDFEIVKALDPHDSLRMAKDMEGKIEMINKALR